jgi:hypothetical protein
LNNLLTGLFAKITSSTALYADVAGRIYLDEAPEGTSFPYIVISIISDVPEDTFTEKLDDVLIQFSLFSISKSVTEIADMYADLKTLFDGAMLTITGDTCLWCERTNLVTMVEEITTKEGTATVKAWHVDYSIKVQD